MGLGVMLFPTTATAGRLLATGHDVDHHCGRAGEGKQCSFFRTAIKYVRAGAPDPSKPVLILDRGELDTISALNAAYGPGVVPHTVIEPRSDAFKSAPITTDTYSAVIIASSAGDPLDPTPQDLNEFYSTPDSDAINARSKDLQAFFNSGGGIYVNSGSTHGDDPGDPYYAFLPITVQGAVAVAPFMITDVGRQMGFVQQDIACCPTHNTFDAASADSALRAIDTDAAGRVVSVVADTPNFTSLGDPPLTQATRDEVAASLPSTKACIRRRTVTLKLRRPAKYRFSRATVYVNGKVVKQLKGSKVTRPLKLKTPVRGTRMNVKVVIFTTGKRRITIKRSYKVCL